jgi:hypothetical protein
MVDDDATRDTRPTWPDNRMIMINGTRIAEFAAYLNRVVVWNRR